MKQKLIRAGMACTVVAALHFAPAAHAEEAAATAVPAQEKSAELPVAASPPQIIDNDADFEKNTDTKGFMPYGKSELEYEIKIPKDWESDEDFGANAPLEENTKQ